MEATVRKNEFFNIGATYTLKGEKVIRPKLTFIPKGLFENSETFDDVLANEGLWDQIRFMDVEASNENELNEILIEQEAKLLKKYKEIAS